MEKRYPWYDSGWLGAYVVAKEIIKETCPRRLDDFVNALKPLTTSPDFQIQQLPAVLDLDTLFAAKNLIKSLDLAKMNKGEAKIFGREIFHNHPFFNKLQIELTDLVSEAANEEVEPLYNFLSLYKELGVCAIHMDAPEAKWTLDVCLEQSVPWPIYFSQTQPWPEEFPHDGPDWEKKIKEDPANHFTGYTCDPGDALFFSGSSQWHYREQIPPKSGFETYSHLVFFHYIPKGSMEIIKPVNWSTIFDIPELEPIKKNFNHG